MKKKILKVSIFLIILVLLILSIRKNIDRISEEYDEGTYLNTFLTVVRGPSIYKETFLSQPPGFFLFTYPSFLLLGKTLAAARLNIFLWSIIGLIGIIWLARELGSIWIAYFTIGILFFIPRYYHEIFTFHADALPIVFSTLSLASMMRFYNTQKKKWFFLSSTFLTIAFWIKFDLSILPSLLYLNWASINKIDYPIKKTIILGAIFLITILILSYLFVRPFGLSAIYENVIKYRLEIYSYYKYSIFRLFIYLLKETILFFVIITALCLSILKFHLLKKNIIFLILSIWATTSFILLFFYRPFVPHHLFILTIPFSLLLSFLLFKSYAIYSSKEQIKIVVRFFLIFVLTVQIIRSLLLNQQFLTESQKRAMKIIKDNTNKNDYIISNDALLTALSERLSLPQLVDLSSPRVDSGNVSKSLLEKNLIRYRPKLFIFWLDKMINLNGLQQLLLNYKYRLLYKEDLKHQIYLLTN